MKKTDRTNKTNLVITWPTNIFTIKELNAINTDFVEITLRVRLKKSIDMGEVSELGVLHNGKGRPTLVLVHGIITKTHVADAKSKGVILKDGVSVHVINISNNSNPIINESSITHTVEHTHDSITI